MATCALLSIKVHCGFSNKNYNKVKKLYVVSGNLF